MKCIVLLLGCLTVMSSNAQAADLYRWVDAQGKVHYGDAPPPDAVQIEQKKFPAAEPGEALPYETRRAQQNFPVTLYVTDNCKEYCDEARNFLNKRGIPFTEKKLLTQEEFDAFKAQSGFDSVPALAVGRNFLRGLQAEQWHNELDIAGYPKTAPYGVSAPSPAASGVAPASPAP